MAPACPHCGSFSFDRSPARPAHAFRCSECQRLFEVPDDRDPEATP